MVMWHSVGTLPSSGHHSTHLMQRISVILERSGHILLRALHSRSTLSSVAMAKEITIPIISGHIAGKVWNEGGSPILGLHGWMDNAGTWDGVAPLLPKSVSLIAIDFPSHGLSSPRPRGTPFHFSNLLLTIERVVQHFGWKEVNIIGHSLGGGAAMLYAGAFPEKVKKIVMVDLIKPLSVDAADQPDKTARGILDFMEAELKIGREPPSYEYTTLLDKMVMSYRFSLTEEAAEVLLKRGSVKHADGLYSFNYDPLLKVGSIFGTSFDQQKAFANRLQCELLLIKASNGPLYESRELYDEIISIYEKKAKKFILKKVEGTHHVHLNNPEIVAPIISEFIEDKS